MTQHRISRALPVMAAVMLSWQSGTAGPSTAAVTTTRPATTQVAPLDVAKLKFVGLLGDPRFRHERAINYLALINQEREIVSTSAEDIAVWDAATGKERCHISEVDGSAAAVLPGGKRLVTGGSGLMIWNLESGKLIRIINGTGFLRSLALTPDGKSVFTAGDTKGNATQWDVESGKRTRELDVDAGNASCLAISPDGKTLLTASGDSGKILIWDIGTGQQLRSVDTAEHIVAVAFAPDGKQFATKSWGSLRIWDVGAGTEISMVGLAWSPTASGLAFSHSGEILALTDGTRDLHLMKVSGGTERKALKLPRVADGPLVFTADGKELFAASGGMISHWKTETGERLFPPAGDGDNVAYGKMTRLALAPDGQRLYSAGWFPTVFVWNTNLQKLQQVWDVELATDPLSALQLSADGKSLLVGGFGEAEVRDSTTGARIRRLELDSKSGTFAYDCDYWAWADTDKAIVGSVFKEQLKLWGPEAGRPVQGPEPAVSRNGETGLPVVLAVSDDGRRALSGLGGAESVETAAARFWNLIEMQEVGELPLAAKDDPPGVFPAIRWARFLHHGNELVTVDHANRLAYWGQAAATPRPSPAELQKLKAWVKDLGASDYQTREVATAKLIGAGPAGKLALEEVDQTDPEVAERMARIHSSLDRYHLPVRRVGQALNLRAGQGNATQFTNYGRTALAVHPDERHWAALIDKDDGSEIVIGELTAQGPRELRRWYDERGACSLVFSNDGKTLYVGNGNATISIYGAE